MTCKQCGGGGAIMKYGQSVMESDEPKLCPCTAERLERAERERDGLAEHKQLLFAENGRLLAEKEAERLRSEIAALKADLAEEQRLNSMGSEREARLMALVDELRRGSDKLRAERDMLLDTPGGKRLCRAIETIEELGAENQKLRAALEVRLDETEE